MPDAEGKLTPDELRERWVEEPGISFREEIIRQLKSEETEHEVDWKKLKVDVDGKEYIWEDFKGVKELNKISNSRRDLRGIDLSDAHLENAYLGSAHLEHANLYDAHLEHADLRSAHLEHAYLISAHLEHANLRYAHLERADLGFAHLEHANLRYAHLEHADLEVAHLEHAVLRYAHLEHANFIGAHLEHADLYRANLEKTDLTEAHFQLKSWWHRFKEILGITNIKSPNRPTLFEGAELKNVKLDSDPVLYRELLDEQYLDKFAEKHPYFYPFWLLTSNCGRNIPILFGWSIFIGILFGLVFADFSSPSWFPGFLRDFLDIIDPKFIYNSFAWWKPFYFSFVTMTTLGMASVEPGNFWAAFWHTIQNLFGYVWLGYLIAVLGSKLTRRSA